MHPIGTSNAAPPHPRPRPPYSPLSTATTSSSSSSSFTPAHKPRFLVVPNMLMTPTTAPPNAHRLKPAQGSHARPSFPIPAVPTTTSTPFQQQRTPAAATMTALASINPTYKPPQHKHAHHLHTIPPREKTTRTLILDHMLWLHSRARLAQAAAELVDEDEVEVKSGKRVDVAAARMFRARADGLEKVLSAMLNQPPEEVPWDADDELFRDVSSKVTSSTLLPNGIRIRIALARLMNDVFVPHDDAPQSSASGAAAAAAATSGAIAPYLPAPPPFTTLSPGLSELSRISSFAQFQVKEASSSSVSPVLQQQLPKLPSFHSFTAAASGSDAPPAHSLLPPAGSIFSTIPRGAGPESPWALGRNVPHGNATIPPIGASSSSSSMMPPPPPPRIFRAVGRSKDLYNTGVNINPGAAATTRGASSSRTSEPAAATAVSSSPSRCPHHLTITCEPSSFCAHVSSAGTEHKKARSTIGAGLGHAGPPLRGARGARSTGSSRGVGGASMTEVLPRFLRLSALVAIELGKEGGADEEVEGKKEGQDTEEDELDADDVPLPATPRAQAAAAATTTSSATPRAKAKSKADGKRAVTAVPTMQWYTLLASLLTRAALQGYLYHSWRGTDPVEILLGVGVGARKAASQPVDDDDEEESGSEKEREEFLPDEWPELKEAWKVLFESGTLLAREDRTSPKPAYTEYERMMTDRISEFFTLPHHDLSTYLDFFSRMKYPQENTDREALRFFEAVSNWRGEPELENLKRLGATAQTPTTSSTSGVTPSITIGTLSSSTATVPTPTNPSSAPKLSVYFTIPPASAITNTSNTSSNTRPRSSTTSSSTSGTSSTTTNTNNKRKARPDASPVLGTTDLGDGPTGSQTQNKKPAVASSSSMAPAWGSGRAWMEPDEYVGPYGI